ncbi:MAG TPA: hypothetical protein VFR31_02430 [Thermoanaerobaculia bacterium]|nr:hypothetical protein [Thermoanaerobaculia bacterium]
MRRSPARWTLPLVCALIAAPASAAPFRVTLESDAVVVSGVTAKGKAALLGVTREIGEDDYPTVKRHLEVLADEDGDGTIRYPMASGVPARSVWAVVDLASGDHDSISPQKFGERRVNWRGRGLERRSDSRDAVEDRRTILELLVVRPQTGAWALRVRDGQETDGDGRIDGRLEGVLGEMKPLGDAPAPPSVFEKDDVVLALDPSAMEITVVKVPKS